MDMDKKTAEHNLTVVDIDASLSYGKVFGGKAWDISVIFLFISSALIIMIAFIGFFYPDDGDSKFFIIFGSVLGGFMLLITLFFYLSVNYGKKKAALWLKDAVVLEAKCTLLGTRTEMRPPIFFAKAAAIRVSFFYNGIAYTRESSYKGKRTYLAIYYKYAGRNIMIAYSPSYDQVMILKTISKIDLLN